MSDAHVSPPASLDRAGLAALTRPRIVFLVLVETAAGFLLADPVGFGILPWLMLGTGLVAMAGCALNHYLEREADARMERTRLRPLVTGALTERQVLLGSLTALAVGLALVARGGSIALWLEVAAAVIYLAVYTPLKRRTSTNTWIGAIPGALPVLVGAAAAHPGELVLESMRLPLMVFTLIFLWQLPHFFAIASMYRDQYQQGGMRMLSGDDPYDALLRWQMPIQVMSVVLVSMLPVLAGPARTAYLATALVLGAMFLRSALLFRSSPVPQRARHVVLTSVVYLPLVLLALVTDVACTRNVEAGLVAAAPEACPACDMEGIPGLGAMAELQPRAEESGASHRGHASAGAEPHAGADGEAASGGLQAASTQAASGDATARTQSLPLASDVADLGTLPEFQLMSEDAMSFTRDHMLGEVWVVDFIFTRCAGICVPMTRGLIDMQADELPTRYLSISIDPARDSPQVLAQYREKWEGDPERWTLATGGHDEITRLANEGFKLPVNTHSRPRDGTPEAETAAVEGLPGLFHSGRYALVDRSGRVRGYYAHDDQVELQRLREDVRRVAEEGE